jgi:cytochrome c553
MSKVSSAIIFFGALMMITIGTVFGAQEEYYQERNANLCFEETVKVANGADPASLSTFRCNRALRVTPLGRENQSAILYNRGIIEKTQGDLVAAQASFEKAVRLSRTVDKRNLALAEVARELGHYHVAVEQYALLTESDFAVDSDKLRAAVLARHEGTDAALFASVEKALACGACHGAIGVSPNPEIPTLAGRHEDELEQALHQFRNGQRQNAMMTSQATQIADDDVAVLARYFAKLDGLD